MRRRKLTLSNIVSTPFTSSKILLQGDFATSNASAVNVKPFFPSQERIYEDNNGDLDAIARALGGDAGPARSKEGVTDAYVQNAERFATLLVAGQLLWSERAPRIGNSMGSAGASKSSDVGDSAGGKTGK